MVFPFALSRIVILSVITIANATGLVLSAIAFNEKTVFQGMAICFSVFALLIVIGCLCHQFAHWDEEANNTRNLGLFCFCGFFGIALAASLTTHAQQDRGVGLCHDFAHVASPCFYAGVQLGMAYVSSVFALAGFVISWIDKFPGAVKVTARYPITKAPSSHLAVYGHDLDVNYTHPPVKVSPRSRNNSGRSDVPLHC